MLFFKIECVAKASEVDTVKDKVDRDVEARNILTKSEEFNENCREDAYCFVPCFSSNLLTIGMLSKSKDPVEYLAVQFAKFLEFEVLAITISEITISGFRNLLNMAERREYIDDCNSVLEKYGLDKVAGWHSRSVTFGENIINVSSKDEVYSDARKYLFSKTLIPELERIYAGRVRGKASGHPVHYFLCTDDRDMRKETYKTLLKALYVNDRIKSKRYAFLDFRAGEDFSSLSYDMLYNICSGCAVVVRYLANDDLEEKAVASAERETIERLCEAAKKYRNTVLTIFCLSRECKKARSIFDENLGTMSFVDIKEDFVQGKEACDFLRLLAKEQHIRCDKKLFAKVREDVSYLGTELRLIFDDWYNQKLRVSVYPQYKEFESVRKETLKATPKGTAYDELQSMIGLTEAKAVITKALNYYKMQKLYEERGIKRDSPAMHMVFTGNPGTAKTTAARLFAGIMKDNGLLSKGQLVEVGRGDLVGKYVGWTAKTVQQKFRAASGGVLFIDEAYSLVDDRDGSFGDEAINTIVQEMENHREDVVVIFAGYPDKMEGFLRKNPGLRSRIAFHVPFNDYSVSELCEIAEFMGKNKGVSFDVSAVEKLTEVFESARTQSDFGNGRYVRNVIELAKMNQASRLLAGDFEDITTEEITTIKDVDIEVPEYKAEEVRRIGFAC